MARRFFWLTVLILFALTAYTGGWYWAADRLVQEVQARTGDLPDGRRVVCANPQAKGFPFRIGLFCDSVAYESAEISVSGGALRSAAQVYNPFKVVAEADGPARLIVPGYVPFDVTWQDARASTRLALPQPMPEIVSTELTGVVMSADMDGKPEVAKADRVQVHMRPAGSDLELALRFDGLTSGLDITSGPLPPLAGLVDLVVKDGIARLGHDIAGAEFTVRNFELSGPGGAKLIAKGTASVGQDRLLDAELTMSAENAAGVTAIMAAAFPALATQIAALAAGMAAMGTQPSLPLTIADGAISLGFIPLGTIPPL